MAQKHVLFTFRHPPFGSIWYTEGLRAVVGVTSGIDEHTVDVVYLGDAVQFALKGASRHDTQKYLGTLTGQGVKIKAERESLVARGLNAADVAEDVEVISRRQVAELIAKADATIDF